MIYRLHLKIIGIFFENVFSKDDSFIFFYQCVKIVKEELILHVYLKTGLTDIYIYERSMIHIFNKTKP